MDQSNGRANRWISQQCPKGKRAKKKDGVDEDPWSGNGPEQEKCAGKEDEQRHYLYDPGLVRQATVCGVSGRDVRAPRKATKLGGRSPSALRVAYPANNGS